MRVSTLSASITVYLVEQGQEALEFGRLYERGGYRLLHPMAQAPKTEGAASLLIDLVLVLVLVLDDFFYL